MCYAGVSPSVVVVGVVAAVASASGLDADSSFFGASSDLASDSCGLAAYKA